MSAVFSGEKEEEEDADAYLTFIAVFLFHHA
jgi:hypothetical protein